MSEIQKFHCFNGESLKKWLIRNKNFIRCKVLGRESPDKSRIKSKIKKVDFKLPNINFSKRVKSCNRFQISSSKIRLADHSELIKRNNEISDTFEKQLKNAYKNYNCIKGYKHGNEILTKLKNCMKKQKIGFEKDEKLIIAAKNYFHQVNKLY